MTFKIEQKLLDTKDGFTFIIVEVLDNTIALWDRGTSIEWHLKKVIEANIANKTWIHLQKNQFDTRYL